MAVHGTVFVLTVFLYTSCSAFRYPGKNEASMCKYAYEHMDLGRYDDSEKHLEYEIICKIDKNHKILLYISPARYYDIDCQNTPNINYDELPSPFLDDDETVLENNFSIEKCQLTNTPLADILEHQRVKKVRTLLLKYSNYANIERKYFAGLNKYNISNLTINDCGLNNVPPDLFQDLPNLRSLDLYSNKIRPLKGLFNALTNLRYLSLSKNNITKLPDEIFSTMSSLKKLYLGRNKLIVQKATFKGLKNLKLLDLSENSMSQIPEDTFEHIIAMEELNLSANNFTSLPSNLMSKNKDLIKLYLINNHVSLKAMPEMFLSNLPKLKEVNITNSGIERIPENMFINSSQIVSISLEHNEIKSLSEFIFKGQVMLKRINVRRNKIVQLPKRIFENNVRLEELYIDNNFIENLTGATFRGLVNLKILSMRKNNLKYIEPLPRLSALVWIDMSFNQLSWSHIFVPTSPFENLKNLRYLYLSNNNITIFCQDWMQEYTLPNLKYLDLSFNHIGDIDSFSDIQFSKHQKDNEAVENFTLDLQNNKITALLFNVREEHQHYQEPPGNVKILINNNPIRCDCRLLTFIKFLKNPKDFQHKSHRYTIDFDINNGTCDSPNSFKNRNISTISLDELACEYKKDERCIYYEYPYNLARKIVCNKGGMNDYKSIPQLEDDDSFDFNHTELYLENNDIEELHIFENVSENITKLYLSGNNLTQLTEKVIPSKIEILDLRNNSLVYVNETVARKIIKSPNLQALKISGNPLACDCDNEKFLSLLATEMYKAKDYKTLQCPNGTFVSELKLGHLCDNSYSWIPLVATLVSIAVLSFIVLLGLRSLNYRRQQDINIWLKEHLNWYLSKPPPPDLDNVEYDVFVSGAHKDNEIVEYQLVPRLEQLGYRVFWHTRDFVCGEFVNNNMASAVLKSQATVAFITNNFLQSNCCRKEFLIADLANTEHSRYFIPILDDYDVSCLQDLDPLLKIYLTKRTYLEYSDKKFWKRLCVSLPKKLSDIRPCTEISDDRKENIGSDELNAVKTDQQDNLKLKTENETRNPHVGYVDPSSKSNDELLNILNGDAQKQVVGKNEETHVINENMERRQGDLVNSEEVAVDDLRIELPSRILDEV